MVRKILAILMLSLAIAIFAVPAGASLVPMSWGFPQMTQDQTLTAFEKNTALATDNEAAAVAFPTSTSSADGIFSGASFPTISQTAAKSNLLESMKFQQQTQHFAFAYPFLSIGGAPVPAMGLM